jgi:hypothetical protein
LCGDVSHAATLMQAHCQPLSAARALEVSDCARFAR